MKINYNVTGADRKKLVLAISEITDEPMNYKGAPTFGYEVGSYYIDKTGMLIGEDNWELVADLSGLHSFVATEETYDIAVDAESEEEAPPIVSFGEGVQRNPDCDYYAEGPQENDIELFDDKLTIEVPIEGFTEDSLSNLEKIVASKASLIKKAIGAEALPIEQTETTIKFPWFKFNANSGESEAYSAFISGLCSAAKEQKRVTAKEKEVENEKFAFRVFLIRLGFVGDEFKAVRKQLLKNLSGNSAFKNGAPPKAEVVADEYFSKKRNCGSHPKAVPSREPCGAGQHGRPLLKT